MGIHKKSTQVAAVCLGILAMSSILGTMFPGCRSNPIRSVMGHNQKILFDLQSHAGDPIEREAIRSDLAAIDSGLASLSGDGPFRERLAHARATLRELREAEWTQESRRELFIQLTAMCRSCHAAYPTSRKRQEGPHPLDCTSCHTKEYTEWKETLHAQSWTDPIYRMSAGDPPREDCRSCHIPEPILLDEFDVSYGYRPYTRSKDVEEGVGCAACHLRPDGSVAATRTLDAPCRPVRDPRIATSEFCGACHNPTHDAYFEWKSSRAADRGVRCLDCHREHHFRGGNDPVMVLKAIQTDCRIEAGEVVITIENLSSHKFPGEVPSRIFHILIRHDGREEMLSFRRPNKQEIGWKDNRLKPDETRTIRWKIPAETRAIVVEFRFQPSPFVLPDAWFLLGRKELSPP